MANIRLATSVGDIFSKCKVIGENDLYFFLEETTHDQFYDIVMPKETANSVKVGDILDVSVDGIRIADDGTPGVFVHPKK